MHTIHVFDRPTTNLLKRLCILVEVLSHTHGKRGKSLNDLKFGTSVGRFSSDGAVSTAVKGLNPRINFQIYGTLESKNELTWI